MKKRSTAHKTLSCFSSILVLTVCLSTSLYAQRSDSEIFIHGADGSVLDEVEQSGGLYYDEGVQKDALEIFKKYGFNLIRLKIWHTPSDQYNSLQNVLDMAKRVKDSGLDFMLDFHYSDTWADPGSQDKPVAWQGLSFDVLTDSIYEYTKHVISHLKAQNTLPGYVQIGNEIICGMLWDDGKVCDPDTPEQWNNLGILIKRAIQGLKDAIDQEDKVATIIHIDKGGNNGASRWYFDNIIQEGVEFDIIGLSFYNWWHGTLADLQNNLNDLATRYNKDIIVVEGAYPWTLGWGDNTNNIVGSEDQLHTGYPATVEGQTEFLKEVLKIIKNTTDDRGKGFVYWSPEWIPGHPGSPWENLALFDFEGEVLESILVFNDNADIDENNLNTGLLQIDPNPFFDSLQIKFHQAEKEHVKLSVSDYKGNEIEVLVDKILTTGDQIINWNKPDLNPGIYLITIKQGNKTQSIKTIKVEKR